LYSLAILVLLCLLVRLFWVRGLADGLRVVMLNRYGLILAAAPVLLVPLGVTWNPSYARGVISVRGPGQMFNVTWMSVLVAFAAMLVCGVTEENALARGYVSSRDFYTGPEPGPDEGWGWARWLAFALLVLPLPYACLRLGALDRGQNRGALWFALVGGLLFGLFLLALGQAIDRILIPGESRLRGAFLFPGFDLLVRQPGHLHWWHDALAAALKNLGNGYVNNNGGLLPGHGQVLTLLPLGLLAYFAHYSFVLVSGKAPDRNGPLPPVFFLLLVVLLAGLMLQGLAFFLDSYGLPPMVVVLAFSLMMYLVNRTDHFFDLNNGPAPAPVPNFPAALANRAIPATHGNEAEQGEEPKPARTLVCVTAAGGGIQASAWVARVLTGLHKLYDTDFTRSIGLLSAVSGGSVGVMYFLDALDDDPQYKGWFRDGALGQDDFGHPNEESIRGRAMASSLTATAWGAAFPDLLRTLFPPAVSSLDDRGRRLELDWWDRLIHSGQGKDKRLDPAGWLMGQLGADMATGNLPVAVFNATIAETGQRMLLWPFLTRPAEARRTATDARELLELYPSSRLPVTTAVRLSATFSYVTPICRPLDSGTRAEDNYHFCDGGYVDNEGMVTLLELLRQLLALPAGGRPFDRILLVRTQPFPAARSPAPAESNSGWAYSVLGPINALQAVRVAGQVERNDQALRCFQAEASHAGVPVKVAEFVFDTQRTVPLNWVLTTQERQEIDTVWQEIVRAGTPSDAALANGQAPSGPLPVIDQWFTREPGGNR
jgi:hypothetical protein